MWKLKIFFRRRIKPKMKKVYLKLKNTPIKKIIMLAAVCGAILLVIMSLLILLLGSLKAMLITDISLIVLAALVVGCLYLTEKASKRWYRLEKPTSYFSDLGWRDVEGLVVGSTKAWKYTDFDAFDGKVYNCVSYKRSLDMDFATLKTYFSHVKKGGKIFMVLDYTETLALGNQITPRDFQYVHPHIFLALNKTEDKKKSAHPLLYYPKATIGHVWACIRKKCGAYKKSSWKVEEGKNINIDTDVACWLGGKLDKMINFCYQRELEPELLLLSGNKTDNQANEVIRAFLAPRFRTFDVTYINNAKELNDFIKNNI